MPYNDATNSLLGLSTRALCEKLVNFNRHKLKARDLFGLELHYSEHELNKSFNAMAKRVHPDKVLSEDRVLATEAFKVVTQARTYLLYKLKPVEEQQAEFQEMRENPFYETEPAETYRQSSFNYYDREPSFHYYWEPRTNSYSEAKAKAKPFFKADSVSYTRRYTSKPLEHMTLEEILSSSDIWKRGKRDKVIECVYNFVKTNPRALAYLVKNGLDIFPIVIAERHFDLFKLMVSTAPRSEIRKVLGQCPLEFLQCVYHKHGRTIFAKEHEPHVADDEIVCSLLCEKAHIEAHYLLVTLNLFPEDKEVDLSYILQKALANGARDVVDFILKRQPDILQTGLSNKQVLSTLGEALANGETSYALLLLKERQPDLNDCDNSSNLNENLWELYLSSHYGWPESQYQDGIEVIDQLIMNPSVTREAIFNSLGSLISLRSLMDSDRDFNRVTEAMMIAFCKKLSNNLEACNKKQIKKTNEMFLDCYSAAFEKGCYSLIPKLLEITPSAFEVEEEYLLCDIFLEINKNESHQKSYNEWGEALNALIKQCDHQLKYKDSGDELKNLKKLWFKDLTPLHLACCLGLSSQVKTLAQAMNEKAYSLNEFAKCTINSPDLVYFVEVSPIDHKYTALHLAIKCGHQSAAVALILAGADLNQPAITFRNRASVYDRFFSQKRTEKTVLQMAQEANQTEVIRAIQCRYLDDYIQAREQEENYITKISFFGYDICNFGYSKTEKIQAAKKYKEILLSFLESNSQQRLSGAIPEDIKAVLSQGRLSNIVNLGETIHAPNRFCFGI